MASASSVYCKFLLSREQFSFRYIRVSDIPEKLSAIVHDGKFYSIFKTVESAEESLEFAVKASISGHELAITQAGQRYILWIHEVEAVCVLPDSKPVADRADSEENSAEDPEDLCTPATFASSPCLIFADPTACQFRYLLIPGYPDRVAGLEYQEKYYRLLQREQDARLAIAAIAERACRGTELAIVPIPNNYGILAFEPLATPMQRSS
jgi:hypothetical protein